MSTSLPSGLIAKVADTPTPMAPRQLKTIIQAAAQPPQPSLLGPWPSPGPCLQSAPGDIFPLPNLWLQRDDSFGIMGCGSKARKYWSLVPYLQQQPQPPIITGTCASNNLVALLQYLRPLGVKPELWLLTPRSLAGQGNSSWLAGLIQDLTVRWLKAEEWQLLQQPHLRSDGLMVDDEQLWTNGDRPMVKEGAWHPMAIPGMLTLAVDLMSGFGAAKLPIQHVFLDAGTGVTAASTILGLDLLGFKGSCHVTLVAGTEDQFSQLVDQLFQLFGRQRQYVQVRCRRPPSHRSFGSTSRKQLHQCLKLFSETGLLLDPVYSYKHWRTMMAACDEDSDLRASGKCFVHSGGTSTWHGFHEVRTVYQAAQQQQLTPVIHTQDEF